MPENDRLSGCLDEINLDFCGARSNTEAVDEAQYSAPFVWTVSFEYCFVS